MWTSPRRDDRDAYLLADVASAHDAGLAPDEILKGPAMAGSTGEGIEPGTSLSAGLCRRGAHLAPHEEVLLAAAEQAGNLGPAIRNLADQRASRARRNREFGRRLLYPSGLLFLGVVVGCISAYATGRSVFVPLLVVAVLSFLGYAVVRYALRTAADPHRTGIPLVRDLVLDLGELPYLQSMHGLYAAGVKLIEAHELATRTAPVPGVRRRLLESGERLAAGESYSEALRRAGALHPETLQMLASAEAAGDFEGALARANRRRQDSADLRLRRLLTVVVSVVVVVVYGYVIYVVFSFYTNLYSGLPGLLGR